MSFVEKPWTWRGNSTTFLIKIKRFTLADLHRLTQLAGKVAPSIFNQRVVEMALEYYVDARNLVANMDMESFTIMLDLVMEINADLFAPISIVSLSDIWAEEASDGVI